MSARISGIVLTLLWLHTAIVLGWGLKDDPAAGSIDLVATIFLVVVSTRWPLCLTSGPQHGTPPRDRDSLKQEQSKWLATREHITAAEKDEKEFVQLRLTRRRVAELEARARYR